MAAKTKTKTNGKRAARTSKQKAARPAKRAGKAARTAKPAKASARRSAAQRASARRRATTKPSAPPPVRPALPTAVEEAPVSEPLVTEAAGELTVTEPAADAEQAAKKGPLARLTSSVGSLFARMTRKKNQTDPNQTVVLHTADIEMAPANPTMTLETSDLIFESPNKTVALDTSDIMWESATPPPIPKSKKKRKPR